MKKFVPNEMRSLVMNRYLQLYEIITEMNYLLLI